MESNLFDVHFREVETVGLPTGWIGKLETKLVEKGQKTGSSILYILVKVLKHGEKLIG